MHKHHRYIFSALTLIRSYDGSVPLHHYLKNFFRKNKKFGSRDRRWIKEICYAWFRAAQLFQKTDDDQRIYLSFYLVHDTNEEMAEAILRCGDQGLGVINFSNSPAQKLRQIKAVFPLTAEATALRSDFEFSHELDINALSAAMLLRPVVWIRVRRTCVELAANELHKHQIAFVKHPQIPCAWSVNPDAKLDDTQLFEKGWAEVQDLSSQQTVNWMNAEAGERWYDACAASGGKSLLLLDHYPDIHITVSDSRRSVIDNLNERFRRNGIVGCHSLILDLVNDTRNDFYKNRFDGIIADVPCSGSGTWTRNPEQQFFFQEAMLEKYMQLQEAITRRLSKMLLPGGKLIYITCSVFKAENEDRVAALAREEEFLVKDSKLIQGSPEGADTLFVACLIKK